MKVMGIDPSMRSTGICLMTDDQPPEYHLICSSPTKKLLNLNCPFIHVHRYDAVVVEGNSVQKEWYKMKNVQKVIDAFTNILHLYCPHYCVIEAIAMAAGSHGRLDQLSFLNGCMRYVCYLHNTPCYAVVATTNKLKFSGMGDAKKEDMVRCWKLADPRVSQYNGYKLDDLADAYALSLFPITEYIKDPDNMFKSK